MSKEKRMLFGHPVKFKYDEKAKTTVCYFECGNGSYAKSCWGDVRNIWIDIMINPLGELSDDDKLNGMSNCGFGLIHNDYVDSDLSIRNPLIDGYFYGYEALNFIASTILNQYIGKDSSCAICGKAKLHADDDYDKAIGEHIAYERLKNKMVKLRMAMLKEMKNRYLKKHNSIMRFYDNLETHLENLQNRNLIR